MSVTTPILAFQVRDAIYTKIAAEMGSGRMATLQDVRKSAHFATGKSPTCGVMLLGWPEPESYGQRRLKTRVDVEIILAVRSTTTEQAGNTPGKIANLDDAMATIEPLIDDGNGNGLVAILNDPTTFGLGNPGVSESRIGKCDFYPVINEGDAQSIWLYASIYYHAVVYPTY